MKKLLFTIFALAGLTSNAQEVKSDSAWSIQGQNSIMLNQAAFSNWVAGGANNVGWNAGVNYNMTYEKGKNLWENIVILGYGQTNTQGLGTRKTQDIINLSTNYGRKISDHWYASAGASLLTQFAPGYDYNNSTPIKTTKYKDGYKEVSGFFAPAYVSLGAGFTYRPNENFTMTLRPANARWTFVNNKALQYKGNYGLKADGASSLFQFGFLGTALWKVQVMDNILLTNNFSLFSNYLDHPERLVVSYGGILNMKINKYISSIITLDLLYDHNQIKRTQVKETLGVGIAYNFDNGVRVKK